MKFHSKITPMVLRDGKKVALISERQTLEFKVQDYKFFKMNEKDYQLFFKIWTDEEKPMSYLVKWGNIGFRVHNFTEQYSFSFSLEDIVQKNKVLFVYRSPEGHFDFLVQAEAFNFQTGQDEEDCSLHLSYTLWQGDTLLQKMDLIFEGLGEPQHKE